MTDVGRDAWASMARSMTSAEAAVVDQGLRLYLLRVYTCMVLALAISGFAALATDQIVTLDLTLGQSPPAGPPAPRLDEAVVANRFAWLAVLAPVLVIALASLRVDRLGARATEALFFLYAVVVGVAGEAICFEVARAPAERTFFVTATAFAALGACGHALRRETSRRGAFLVMITAGTLAASAMELLLGSLPLQPAVSIAAVAMMAIVTTWDGRRLTSEYVGAAVSGDVTERSAVRGAFSLYLDFINVFRLLRRRGG